MNIRESFRKLATQQHLLAPALLLVVVVMFLIPLPVMILDLMLATNFTISLTILMSVLYMPRPTSFSSFPSVLLMSTLFRLSLNVSSTRVILLKGHEGTEAAGSMIQAFGNFVAGGEFIIGIIISKIRSQKVFNSVKQSIIVRINIK